MLRQGKVPAFKFIVGGSFVYHTGNPMEKTKANNLICTFIGSFELWFLLLGAQQKTRLAVSGAGPGRAGISQIRGVQTGSDRSGVPGSGAASLGSPLVHPWLVGGTRPWQTTRCVRVTYNKVLTW